jgi:3-oxoadipate enol-lactonase
MEAQRAEGAGPQRSGTVDVGDVSLYYEVLGDGEPVVLLNGVMMTTQSWVLQTRRLAAGYRCILHDFRGQLRSGKPAGSLSMETHVADLVALLDHLGIERAHLIGTSYGGEVGMMTAFMYPARVKSLAVVSSVSHVEPLLRQQVGVWAETARHAPERLYDVTAPQNFSNAFLSAHPEVLQQGRERLKAYPADFYPAFARLVDAFLELDITARLGEIVAPTLVVCGEADALKPVAYSRLIASRVPEAEFLVVPDAGHAVVIERAETVNTALLGFLAKHASGA